MLANEIYNLMHAWIRTLERRLNKFHHEFSTHQSYQSTCVIYSRYKWQQRRNSFISEQNLKKITNYLALSELTPKI